MSKYKNFKIQPFFFCITDPKYSTKDIVDAREEAPPLPPKSGKCTCFYLLLYCSSIYFLLLIFNSSLTCKAYCL